MSSAAEANYSLPMSSGKASSTAYEKDSGSHFSPKSGVFESIDNAPIYRQFDQKLALKIDLHVLLPMLFLNFFSLMGRTNIGTALIQKLPQDLKLNAMDVVVAISLAFIPLIALEIPSNILMRSLEKKMGLGYIRYLAITTAFLGIVTIGQAFDQTKSALFATRFVLGIFDAGLLPGSIFVCSLYYPAAHLQWRMAMIMLANISSNACANIMAYAIAHITSSSLSNWHGWRWIFLVEGCLTFGISVVMCYSSIARPETARFLTEEEKRIVARDVESRETTIGVAKEVKIFLSNILNYVWAAAELFTASTTYSIAIFAPSFVQAFHPKYTVPQVQGQVVPIFVVSAVACLTTAYLADRLRHRVGFALGGYAFTIIGFAILQQSKLPAPSISMLGLYFVSIGTYVSMPMLWSLTLSNLPSPFQKAIGVGFVIGIGNVGAFTSAWFFRTAEAPRYHSGITNSLIFTVLAFTLLVFATVFIVIANKRSNASATTGSIGEADTDDDNLKGSGQVRRYRL